MFDRLVASDPTAAANSRRRFPATGLSILAHGALIVGALAGTMSEPPAPTSPVRIDTIVFPTRPHPNTPSRTPVTAASVIPRLSTPALPSSLMPVLNTDFGVPEIETTISFDSQGSTHRSVSTDAQAGVGTGSPDGRTYLNSAVEEVPERLGCAALRYPPLLARAGIEGAVTLSFIINPSGRVEHESIQTLSSDRDQFDHAARRMLSTCRFRPGRVAGQPVRVLVEQTFRFTLWR